MKRLVNMLPVIIVVLGLSGPATAGTIHLHSGRAGIFYSSLQPYGDWIEMDLGYAWRPAHVALQWRPYLNGRWMWTDYGWYWVSDEPFGWATYHYGRWHYDDYYGWVWFPDNVWGPSWVEWRYDTDYIGWAPLPPQARFSIHVGITFTSRWVAPVHYWSFVPCGNFTAGRVHDYVQPIERTRRIYGNTRAVVGIRHERDKIVNNGLDVSFVEQRSQKRIHRVEVVARDRAEGDRIVRNNNRERIEVYRPRLDDAQFPSISKERRNDRLTNDRDPGKRIGEQSDRTGSELRIERRHELRKPAAVESDRGRDRSNQTQDGYRQKSDQLKQGYRDRSPGNERISKGFQRQEVQRERSQGTERGERGTRGRRP